MNIPQILYLAFDSFMIWFYRLSDVPIFGYLTGTAVLALLCVVLGSMTLSLSVLMNYRFLSRDNREMVKMHNLSLRALVAKDKSAYKACNKRANDAFGKFFFSRIALGVSSLWPAPFALGWMQTRFQLVDFPLPFHVPFIGDSVGYSFTFIPLFILMHILFGKVKNKLPYFRHIQNMVESENKDTEEMISLADLAVKNV